MCEQGGECFDLNRLSIRHKLHDAEPAVSPVAMPLPVGGLGVEHHLGYVLACAVFVSPEADIALVVCYLAFMSAYHHADVGGRIAQFLPDGFSVIGG